ncbi:transcription antitermination factor NusB [Chitinispirillales bacterium ANBcel5]|uniref:transcription antitermination factor NusB n=1 Tax=Cellulosispirillum alkaliphilum TaxID=3039283 RepID=UPI002A511C61|nr:transcription antitermination factor NusB [Chitinispirillales bacterium ANBcel5]
MSDNNSPQSGNEVTRLRHKSRQLALHTLYACEVGETKHWASMLDKIADADQLSVEVKKYAKDLVDKTLSNLEQIDDILVSKAQNWEIRRMAAVDRNVLRLAITELTYFPKVPYKVVIDEAVEIAKTFGTSESGKFVNGILDSIIHKKTNN